MSGTPIAGAQIDVAVRARMRGATYAPAGGVGTDAAGRFSVRLPPGTSRTIRLRHGTSQATAEVVTPAQVRLVADPRTTRNGRAVRFGGRVSGTSAPTRVELQAWSAGKWIPFRTVALRKGLFQARYRFTRTAVTTRYRFRAVVHDDADFPFAAGRSPVVFVLVRA
jgi:hypothetical protein